MTSGKTVDFDIHGIVGVRLVDAPKADADAVRAQLGPTEKPLDRDPDIIIRYVENPIDSSNSHLRLLDFGDSGFTDTDFVVMKKPGAPYARLQFDSVGKHCEILAQPGIGPIKQLIAIVNLTALARGVVPLHAAAFEARDTGVLITGWAKGGKTETLLGFMSNGARYIGDEWVYVDAANDRIYGLPERIKLWEWLLEDLPGMRARLTKADRARFRAVDVVYKSAMLPARAMRPKSLRSLFERAAAIIGRQRFVHSTPQQLFGEDKMDLAGSFQKVFWVVSHDEPDVRVETIDPNEIAERMVHSLEFETLRFYAEYLAFRYAFPGASNDVVENARELRTSVLKKALQGKQAYVVYHPYPAPILEMHDAIDAVLLRDK